MKKIIYIDLDNTLANYLKKANELNINPQDAKYVKGFFESLEPMPGAIEAFDVLFEKYDVYILTTSPWSNPDAAAEKLRWVQRYFPKAYKRVIISHHKNLNNGDYLIDDMPKNGACEFNGEWIQIGSGKFPDWETVVTYLT